MRGSSWHQGVEIYNGKIEVFSFATESDRQLTIGGHTGGGSFNLCQHFKKKHIKR
jgi:hypothetical protein